MTIHYTVCYVTYGNFVLLLHHVFEFSLVNSVGE